MGLDVWKTEHLLEGRQSPGNSYRFRITIHLSRFRSFSQSIARVPDIRTQAPESKRTSEDERKMLRGELLSCRLVPVRRRPWNPALYRADHRHSFPGQTELCAILSRIAWSKVWHSGSERGEKSFFIDTQDIHCCWSKKDLSQRALADVFHSRSNRFKSQSPPNQPTGYLCKRAKTGLSIGSPFVSFRIW